MSQRRTTLLLLLLCLGFLLLLVLVPVANLIGGFYSAADDLAGPPPPEEEFFGAPSMGDAEAAHEPERPEVVEPTPPKGHPGYLPALGGCVIDVDTREPVSGARVVYASLSGRETGWWGTSTDAAGRFRLEPGTGLDRAGESFEIRVVAAGYITWRGFPLSPEMSIEVGRERGLPRPGRISGRAVCSQGDPLAGVIDVVMLDEVFVSVHQSALVDENGSFVLEGLAPGPRQVFLEWGGRRENVFVPEGGEATVELVSLRTKESYFNVQAPWTQEDEALMTAYLGKRSDLRSALQEARDRGAEARAAQLAKELAKIWKLLTDLSSRRPELSAKLRRVVIKGFPAGSPAVLTALAGGRRWVMEVRKGRVEFSALHEASWQMTFVSSDGEQTQWRLYVPAGEGRFEATFPGR